ncbi:MAG: hypothetical protein AB1657_04230 [Candidatus Micrarchaeota archaeon]
MKKMKKGQAASRFPVAGPRFPEAGNGKQETRNRRGQAALDFLITYGWALLIVLLVAAALFVLGIFDIGSFIGNRPVAFTQVAVPAFILNSGGDLSVKLQNQVGVPISVNSINATYAGDMIDSGDLNISLGVGEISDTIPVGAFNYTTGAGTSFQVVMRINYTDRVTGFSYIEAGTLNGVVQ